MNTVGHQRCLDFADEMVSFISLSGVRELFSFRIRARCASFCLCIAASCANPYTDMVCISVLIIWVVQQTIVGNMGEVVR